MKNKCKIDAYLEDLVKIFNYLFDENIVCKDR